MNLLRLRRHHTPEPEKSETDPMAELIDCFEIDLEGQMAELKIDKLTAEYSQRIPEITADRIGRLTDPQKKELKVQILVAIAKYLHEASFDPSRYLSEDYNTRNGAAR
jgi:hypothetical protein